MVRRISKKTSLKSALLRAMMLPSITTAEFPDLSNAPTDKALRIESQDRALHFSQIGQVSIRTGEGLIAFELPLAVTSCLSYNFLNALDYTYGNDHPVWKKVPNLRDDVEQIRKANELMGYEQATRKLCHKPELRVNLNPIKVATTTSSPPPTTAPTNKWNYRSPCYRLRIGNPCTVRRKRNILDFLNKAKELVDMATTSHKSNRRLPIPTMSGLELFASTAKKIARAAAGFHLGSIINVGTTGLNLISMWKTTHRLNKLSAHVQEMYTTVGQLATSMANIINHLQHEHELDKYKSIANFIAQYRNTIHDTASALINRNFPTNAYDHKEFEQQIANLQNIAAEKGDEILNDSPLAILQSETSFLFDKHGNLNIYVKVPFFRKQLTMDLMRFHHTPFNTTDGPHMIDTNIRYIAVTSIPAGTFFTLTEAEFQNCRIITGRVVCPQIRSVLRVDHTITGKDDQRCIHAAFTGNNIGVGQFCSYKKATIAELIDPISETDFLAYSNRHTRIAAKCNKNPHSNEANPGTYILSMKDGCSADTQGTTIWTAYTLDAQNTYLDRNWQPPAAFQALQNLKQEDIRILTEEKITIKQLRERTNQRAQELKETHNMWNNPVTITLFVILALFLAFGLAALDFFKGFILKSLYNRLFRKTRSPSQQQAHTPPPMQPGTGNTQQQCMALNQLPPAYPNLGQQNIYADIDHGQRLA